MNYLFGMFFFKLKRIFFLLVLSVLLDFALPRILYAIPEDAANGPLLPRQLIEKCGFEEAAKDQNQEVLKYIKQVKDQRFSPGYLPCAVMYEFGFGVKADQREAVVFYEQWLEVEKKDSDIVSLVSYKLGLMYLYGWGIGQDIGKALNYLQKSECKKYAFAMVKLAELEYYGIGLAKNRDSAKKRYKAAAKKLSDCESWVKDFLGPPLYNLVGDFYKDKRNIDSAVKYWSMAGRYNHPDAIHSLKTCHRKYSEVKWMDADYQKRIKHGVVYRLHVKDDFSENTINYINLKSSLIEDTFNKMDIGKRDVEVLIQAVGWGCHSAAYWLAQGYKKRGGF